jgi:peptidyl-prolyl cis-trans isomerase SurA
MAWAMAGLMALGAASMAVAQAPPLDEMDIVLRSVPRGAVARINGESVPSRQFIDMYLGEIDMHERMQGRALSDAQRVAIGMRTLGMLVEREVMAREAAQRGIRLTDDEVEAAWRAEMEDLTEGMRRRGLPVPTEEEVLERAGVSRHEAMQELRTALTVDRLQKRLAEEANIRVDEAEVRRRFEERKEAMRQPERIHVQQIFIAKPPTGGADGIAAARTRAEAALQRIRAGQRFETVARDASEGALAERGGDPGPMPANRMPPFMVAAARAMELGDVSEVLESEVGFHVIRLQEILHGEEPDFESAREQIRSDLLALEGLRVSKEFVTARLESGDYEILTYLDIDRQLMAHPDVVKELQAFAFE